MCCIVALRRLQYYFSYITATVHLVMIHEQSTMTAATGDRTRDTRFQIPYANYSTTADSYKHYEFNFMYRVAKDGLTQM